MRARALERLLLQRAERVELALRLDDLLDPRGAQRPDEFVLEVGVAHVDPFQRGRESRASPASQRPTSSTRVRRTTEESPQCVCAADRDDVDALGAEVASARSASLSSAARSLAPSTKTTVDGISPSSATSGPATIRRVTDSSSILAAIGNTPLVR
jgi:hypothetical protein